MGVVARVASRVAAQQAGRNRTLGAAVKGGRVTLAHFSRVLHLLWLEVVGFVYLSFAVTGGAALVREYPKYQAGKVGAAKIVAPACFMVLFAYFGVSSFLRTRKKRP